MARHGLNTKCDIHMILGYKMPVLKPIFNEHDYLFMNVAYVRGLSANIFKTIFIVMVNSIYNMHKCEGLFGKLHATRTWNKFERAKHGIFPVIGVYAMRRSWPPGIH
jgi:hypothetical protein